MSFDILPIPVNPTVLHKRQEFLDQLETQLAGNVDWYDCTSAAAYRKMRREGVNGFVTPVLNPKAQTICITARDGHDLELRIIYPSTGPNKGVWLHFHAGGWVIGSNASYDPYLTLLADSLCLTMVSVEYRLAPEHPFPTPLNDCIDAALFALSSSGEKVLRSTLKILGGESAGGWLAVSTALALRRDHGIDVQSVIDAIVAGYGIYDLTYTPSLLEHTRCLVLSKDGMMRFAEAAFGHIPMTERKQPLVSPLYADLEKMPPSLFLSGDIEPLVDDSIFMAARWRRAGNQAELKIVQGACHAFTIIRMGDATDEGISLVVDFVKTHLKPLSVKLN